MMKKISIMFLCCFLLLCACTSETVSRDESPEESLSASIGLTINGYTVYLNPTISDNWIEPMSMAADAPNIFVFSTFSGYKIKCNNIEVQSGDTVEVMIDKGYLKKSDGIEIEFTNKKSGLVTKQFVRCLNEGFPEFITINNGAEYGYYYFDPTQDWIVKMNTNSEIIYFNYCEDNFYDFKPIETKNGELYYSYLTPYSDPDEKIKVVTNSFTECKAVIMNSNYQVVKEILGTLDEDGKFTNIELDMHEFLMFDEMNYITLSYIPTYVDNIPEKLTGRGGYPSRVYAAYIQEVRDGKVAFEWKSTDYPEFYDMSVEGNQFDFTNEGWCDYIHINSIDICPNDGNLVLSMRHADSVVEIDRKTGDIVWILGGKHDMFKLKEEEKFTRQHFARFTDSGTLTLFDNSTNYVVSSAENYIGNGTGFPRTIEFSLDEREKTILDYKSYDYKVKQSEVMGSSQKLADDIFLIGWGASMEVPSKILFSEIDFISQKVLFEASNKSGVNVTYRVHKFHR